MKKIICNVASYNRTKSLLKSINSIYNQVDIINVSLNDFKTDIPKELIDDKINLIFTDNSKGDGFKFINLINSDGYFLTIDDDLIYPNDYVKYMIEKCNQYENKSIITLHGRNFGKLPIQSYYGSAKERYSCLETVNNDVKVQYGGTGVMCFDTNLFKIGIEYFQYPNMADAWIGKYAKEHNIPIICAKHNQNYIQYIPQKETIFDTESKKDLIQTKIVNDTRLIDLSIIIPTFNNVGFIKECLSSVIKSVKSLDCEILVGIDNCEKTLNFVKKEIFDSRIRFFYFSQNVGPYIVKNTLVKNSNSETILFFDSDDVMCENMVEEILKMQSFNDFVRPKYSNFNGVIPTNNPVNKEKLFGEGVFSINKSLFLSMNGFEGWRTTADTDFIGRLYKNSRKSINTPTVLFYRRLHQNSLTQSKQTGHGSKIRSNYNNLIRNKKTFGPLPYLYVSPFYEVSVGHIKPIKPIEVFDEVKHKKMVVNEVVKKILSNTNLSKTNIDYDLINKITQKQGVYVPVNHIKSIRENKPVDRTKITEIKKDSLLYQSQKFGDVKKSKKSSSPNIFSGNNRRKGGPLL